MRTATDTADVIKCALCGHTYSLAQAQAACQGCPFHRKCRLMRCPNCGYESPAPRAQA